MTDSLLAHNRNLVAYIERLLRDLEDVRRRLRNAEDMARQAIEDRLAADKKCWGLAATVQGQEEELRQLKVELTVARYVAGQGG